MRSFRIGWGMGSDGSQVGLPHDGLVRWLDLIVVAIGAAQAVGAAAGKTPDIEDWGGENERYPGTHVAGRAYFCM